MVDPRTSIINERLSKIGRIMAVSSGKGGVGKGMVAPTFEGLAYMSLVYFVGDNPAPLRGADVSNALIELLSITQWGELDFLVIDMPPGISDVILDLIR